MCPTCFHPLRGMKLLIKYELLQSWCHGVFLLLKFEMSVSYRGCVTYNSGGWTW